MNTQLYIGNLSTQTTEPELRAFFAGHGTVTEISIPKDPMTGQSRGFAFVTMGSNDEMKAARAALSGKELQRQPLTIYQARPKPEGGSWQRSRGGF